MSHRRGGRSESTSEEDDSRDGDGSGNNRMEREGRPAEEKVRRRHLEFGGEQYQERGSLAIVPARRYRVEINESMPTNLEGRLRSNEAADKNVGGISRRPYLPKRDLTPDERAMKNELELGDVDN